LIDWGIFYENAEAYLLTFGTRTASTCYYPCPKPSIIGGSVPHQSPVSATMRTRGAQVRMTWLRQPQVKVSVGETIRFSNQP